MTENKLVVACASMTSTICGDMFCDNKYIVGRISGRNLCYVNDGIERKCSLREDIKILGTFFSSDREDIEKLIKDFNIAIRNKKSECICTSQNIDAATALLRDIRTINPLCSIIVGHPGERVLDNITNTVERLQMGANALIELFGRELSEHKSKLSEIEIDFLNELNQYFV